MHRRGIFGLVSAVLASVAIGLGRAQDVPQFQHVTNPPRCPLCGTPVTSPPVWLMATDSATEFNLASLPQRSLVCPKDGVIFCVQE